MKFTDYLQARTRPIALYSNKGKEVFAPQNIKVRNDNRVNKVNPKYIDTLLSIATYNYNFPFIDYFLAHQKLHFVDEFVVYTLYADAHHSFQYGNPQRGLLMKTTENQLFIYNTKEDILLQVVGNTVKNAELTIVDFDSKTFLQQCKL